MHTLQTMYEDEVRAVEITILDQDNAIFEPDNVYVTIYDEDDNIVISETAATVSSNAVSIIINTTTTVSTGNYKLKWRIVKDSYTYYHLTNLIILES